MRGSRGSSYSGLVTESGPCLFLGALRPPLVLLGEQFLVRSADRASRWGWGCHTPPPCVCVCVGGLMQMSPRACSWVTGHSLPELFSLQLDFDLGLPHTEAIHSSSSPRQAHGGGLACAQACCSCPAALGLRWAMGGGRGLLTAPPPFPPESLALSVPQFLSGEHQRSYPCKALSSHKVKCTVNATGGRGF